MLPPAPKDVGRLSDVLASVLASVSGTGANQLRLPKVKHGVVILVDGLGYENLQSGRAYARFLNSKLDASIRCEFPSTTATSLAGLASAARSDRHGVIGYSVFDRSSASFMNLLTGWSSHEEAGRFKKLETISESEGSVAIRVIGPAIYEKSGFTALTMPNAQYVVADSIESRFQELLRNSSEPSVTYLYVPELDQLAHRFGVESMNWLNTLEELDQIVSRFVDSAPSNSGVVLTADHGVIDVGLDRQNFLDEFEWYVSKVIQTAGDPRCNFVYLTDVDDLVEVRSNLESQFGSQAIICDVNQLKDSGWADWTNPDFEHYVPDLVIIWNGEYVGYDRRFAKAQSLKMIGQHGGISDRETRVPLIRLGAY